MEAITEEHSEECLEAMGIEMKALQRAVTWDVVPTRWLQWPMAIIGRLGYVTIFL